MAHFEILYSDGRYPFAAGAAYSPGDAVIRPCGTLAVLDGLESVASGALIQPAPLHPTKVGEVKTASATTFTAADVVYWDNTNKVATATASGNKRLGVAARAKTNGQLVTLVNFNVA